MTFNDRYKDRDPEDTIKIIRSFFSKRGFLIIEKLKRKTEINTWVYGLALYYNEQFLFNSVGKGGTEILCKASAYAEMYERFCNKIYLFSNPFSTNKVLNLTFDKKGYYISEDEEIFDISYAFNEKYFHRIFKKIIDNSNFELINKIMKLLYNQYIAVPYKNICNSEKYLIDPRIVVNFGGSTGMAAGNTLEEALVQGISEICERHVNVDILSRRIIKNTEFFCIKNEKLKYLKCYKIIEALEKRGNRVYIFDLSYNYDLPVVVTIVANKRTHNFDVNYGSHPIFEIALERTFTELYQANDYEYILKHSINKPLKSNLKSDYLYDSASMIKTFFPEHLLLNMKIIDKINENCFLNSENYTNEYLLEWQKKILNRNNFVLFFKDYSISNDIYAIHIISPNTYKLGMHLVESNITEKPNDFELNIIVQYLEIFKYLKNNKIKQFKKEMKVFIKSVSGTNSSYYTKLFLCDSIISLYSANHVSSFILFDAIKNCKDLDLLYKLFSDTFFNKHIKLVLLIKMYKQSKKYSDKEIIKLFSYMGVDKKFIKECDIIVDGILKPYYEEYNSERYQKYCETYCKD